MSSDKSTKRKYPPIKANEINTHEQNQFKGVFDRMHRASPQVEVHQGETEKSTVKTDGSPQLIKAEVHQIDNQTSTALAPILPPQEKTDLLKSTETGKAPLAEAEKPTKFKGGSPPRRKGDRHAREGKARYQTRISEGIMHKIKVFCAQNKLELGVFAELSAIRYIESVEVHQKGSADFLKSIDDRREMLPWKTHPFLINLYLRYNPKNKWKVSDDEEAYPFNEVDERIIELAIIQTQSNAGFKRVYTFKYYIGQIEEHLAAPLSEETLEHLVKHYREMYQKIKERLG